MRTYGRDLKHEYCYRLILDESISFGTVDLAGRGLTELHNVPVYVSIISPCTSLDVAQAMQIDVSVRLVADSLDSFGGFSAVFCAADPSRLSRALQ